MSVVGFDVGNDASCVALARKRGIDVLLNKESKRETPAMVSFGDKMRFLGTDAYGKISMNPKNTVTQLKRLLGKRFEDPQVQADAAKLPFQVGAGSGGGVTVTVRYCNESATFAPEQLLAMLLVDSKRIAEEEGGIPVTDCCISAPAYFTEPERYAVLNAAAIAGVNCLRLINETTATALAYGIYKTDLPDADPIHVAFVDVGHSATQVSIVALKKSGLQVKCHAWDRNLGGRNFDEVLFDHFAGEFKEKTRLDVTTNAKAAFKLRSQCEKVKKILSANNEAALAVECLMEDTDLRSFITRDKFEELSAPLLARFEAPLAAALEASGLSKTDMASVEVVGSSTRVPAVFRIIESFFGQTPSRTLNAKEVVCRGCALQCAMLSPVFKVRDFEVVDACPYSLGITYDKDGAPFTQVLFDRNSPFPTVKAMTFLRSAPFALAAGYLPDPALPVGTPQVLANYSVGPFKVPEGQDKAKVKVFVRMNLHGLVGIDQVQAYEEEEVAVEEPAAASTAAATAAAAAPGPDAPAGTADAAAPDAAGGEANGVPTPMEADGAASAAPPKTKRRTRKHDVPVAASGALGLDVKTLEQFFEAEGQMRAADKLQEDTNEAKNALEAYIYALRGKLYEGLAPYVRESDREALAAQLTAMEDWLYDEGEDETKSVYVGKLAELKKVGGPIEARAAEDDARPVAVEELRRAADGYLSLAGSELPVHIHFTKEERDTLAKEAGEALSWLQEKLALQSQMHKYDDPVLLVADIHKKRDVLERVCKPIATKPPAKPAAPAAPAATPAEGAAEAPGSGEGAAGPAPMESEQAPVGPQPMEEA